MKMLQNAKHAPKVALPTGRKAQLPFLIALVGQGITTLLRLGQQQRIVECAKQDTDALLIYERRARVFSINLQTMPVFAWTALQIQKLPSLRRILLEIANARLVIRKCLPLGLAVGSRASLVSKVTVARTASLQAAILERISLILVKVLASSVTLEPTSLQIHQPRAYGAPSTPTHLPQARRLRQTAFAKLGLR